ncbi:MAG: LysR family transcriptional regulator [Hominenteromicrobium sp.]
MITYDYYRIFYYVARYRSFTRAAEALNNNQPNITRCINILEQELGCKLFVRSNRGAALTPEGERLYAHVAVACEQLRAGEEELRKDCGLEGGTISIGASETALHLILLDKLSAFHERYPGVHLRITNDSTPQAIAALQRGQVNCAVVTAPCNAAKPLRETPLLSFREIPVVGPQLRHLAEKLHCLQDLEPYPMVSLGEGTSTYDFYQLLFLRHGLPFHVDIEAATMDQVLPMVEHNLGIGFFAEMLAARAIEQGQVFPIHLKEELPERAVCLIEDASHPQSIAMKAFKRLLCGK